MISPPSPALRGFDGVRSARDCSARSEDSPMSHLALIRSVLDANTFFLSDCSLNLSALRDIDDSIDAILS